MDLRHLELGGEGKDFRGVNHDRTSQFLGKSSHERRTLDVMGVSSVKQLAWQLIAWMELENTTDLSSGKKP